MKSLFYFLLISTFGLTSFSCKSDDDKIDYDTISVVYDIKNHNFELVDGVYQIAKVFNTPLYNSDVVLIYKQIGNTNGAPIWQQIPITIHLTNGQEVDYNFDFSKFDFVIYAGGTFDLGGSGYIINQTFRAVVVPAAFGKSNDVDFSDYDSVISYFDIDDSTPIEL
ncbi:MAG: hypothetical protein PHO74_06810 [Weeksellaceae bacterium]|nr:hypothetical protein [Weeksellaceae bacterium]